VGSKFSVTCFTVFSIVLESSEHINESDKSVTSPYLRTWARVTAQAGNTEESLTAADVSTIGISITSGIGKTFLPAKSLPRMSPTPFTGKRKRMPTLTGPETRGDALYFCAVSYTVL
uniref:Uncharacterized protein n=1 Tax=Gouania willdenowi TaxID=441366 RepID=A0A8C5DKE0_GOUWI